jgi:uncharacterized phage protein (TIGR01671 family)
MRDFKFRAWDKKKKTWTNYQIIDDMTYFMDKITGVWHRDDEFKRFKLLQYTGMQDKNKKEIYEGDIIKIVDENGVIDELDPNTGFGTVIWFEEYAFWYVDKIENGLGGIINYYNVEVIGNIYDNPELLRSENNVDS